MATIESDELEHAVSCSPEIMSGAPVFAGTRVPVKTLWDYLGSGENIEAFLDDFPTVTRVQVLQVVRAGGDHLLADLGKP